VGITTSSAGDGVTLVTVDYPPVNALPVQGWFDLADAIRAAGRDQQTHAVVLRAEGRELRLELCGTTFPGYEWYEQQLRDLFAYLL